MRIKESYNQNALQSERFSGNAYISQCTVFAVSGGFARVNYIVGELAKRSKPLHTSIGTGADCHIHATYDSARWALPSAITCH